MENQENLIYLDDIYKDLKNNLSSHLTVTLKQNILFGNEYIEVKKNSFVGLKIFISDETVRVDSFIPGILARGFFGGIISGVFHSGDRADLQNKIINYLNDKYFNDI